MNIEWISVGERLPEDKQDCIVCCEDATHSFTARYIGGRQFHDSFKNWVKVDYWMPMPQPRKD